MSEKSEDRDQNTVEIYHPRSELIPDENIQYIALFWRPKIVTKSGYVDEGYWVTVGPKKTKELALQSFWEGAKRRQILSVTLPNMEDAE